MLITTYYRGSRVNSNLFERYHIRVCLGIPSLSWKRAAARFALRRHSSYGMGVVLHNHELYNMT